nr:uncharacterized protein LOC129384967 [Dermacentor andersoni]
MKSAVALRKGISAKPTMPPPKTCLYVLMCVVNLIFVRSDPKHLNFSFSSGPNAYKSLANVSSPASPEPESCGRHAGSEQRLIDRSQAHHSTSETNSGPSSSSNAPQYMLLVGAVATLVFVIVVNLSLDFRQPASPGRMRFPSCTSETCRHYAQLFTDSMNLSVSACDNFYSHVCGRWDSSRVRTGEESILVESWKRLARRVGSRLSLVQVPSQNLEPIHRAARYIREVFY